MLYIPKESELKGMTTFEKCIYLDEVNRQNPDHQRMLDILNNKDEREETTRRTHIKPQLTMEERS